MKKLAQLLEAPIGSVISERLLAYTLVKRAFPEAGKLARPDDSEMTFTLTGDPHLMLPDLR